jgi:hypothetical protein
MIETNSMRTPDRRRSRGSSVPRVPVRRLAPDGKSHAVLVKRPGETLHNLMWGRGQGWSETKLYIVSLGNGLFEADPGVRGKKYW